MYHVQSVEYIEQNLRNIPFGLAWNFQWSNNGIHKIWYYVHLYELRVHFGYISELEMKYS